MEEYGVVYLGYRNWWGTMPMAVFTFLEASTSPARPSFRSARTREADLAAAKMTSADLSRAKVLKGLAVRGGSVTERRTPSQRGFGRLDRPTDAAAPSD